MNIFTSPFQLQKHLLESGTTWGFVPTMGGLHKGHAELLRRAQKENEKVLCSLFVNPTQFDRTEDYLSYPEDVEKDKQYLEALNCDVLFLPDTQDMYPTQPLVRMDFGPLTEQMEGKYRPGHLQGAALILSKLFHLLPPQSRVYMGQKDWQQCCVTQRLVEDLGFLLTVRLVPTVRHSDGLAYASRNARLTKAQRTQASGLYAILSEAKKCCLAGENVQEVCKKTLSSLQGVLDRVDYVKVVDSSTLKSVVGNLTLENTRTEDLQEMRRVESGEAESGGAELPSARRQNASILAAGWLGDVRLIDNVLLYELS